MKEPSEFQLSMIAGLLCVITVLLMLIIKL
jgi:hypothetical protein